ncbi:hypothetical protein [Halalkalibacter oceani]|uniref:hypothetical protein n=1 Tax=Halalkalibacter oceani TaxID=1653776 RepID=UPI0033958DF6
MVFAHSSEDRAGNTVETHSNRFQLYTPSGTGNTGRNDSSDSSADDFSSPSLTIELSFNPDGGINLHVDPSAFKKITLEDGVAEENFFLSKEMMNELIAHLAEGKKPYITLEINNTEEAVQMQFPAGSLGVMLESYLEAVFKVMRNVSNFQLHENALVLQGLGEQLGVEMGDMSV